MAFFIYEKDDINMSNFNDIRVAYRNYLEEKTIYWNELESCIQKLYVGFGNYLGIYQKTYLDISKKKDCNYLDLGILENGEFQQKLSGFSGNNLSMDFAFKLIVDVDETTYPKNSILIDFSIKKDNSRYFVTKSMNSIQSFFDVTNDQGISELFSSIVDDILKLLDVKQFK